MLRVEAAPFSSADELVLIGPSIRAHVGFDPEYDPKFKHKPFSQAQDVWALVDTGATESSIDSELARKLNLPLVDRQYIGGVGGRDEFSVFLAQIHIPDLERTIYGRLTGLHLAEAGFYQQVLLGRSFLSGLVMIYDGLATRVTLLA